MYPFKADLFNPPFWLSNPHLQTILPKILAKKPPAYRRELLQDSLQQNNIAYDFYDVADETEPKNNQTTYKKPLVVLLHGLEGSSQSHYCSTLAHYIHAQSWHFVVLHFRSCGGVKTTGNIFYNAGDTAELAHSLNILKQRYTNIYAIGISLGGNILGKYLGESKQQSLIDSAVVVSAPVDLSSAAIAIKRFMGRHVYTPYLLKPLTKKALATSLSQSEIKQIKNAEYISDFDHVYTAEKFGYRSVNDYYRQASSLPYLIDICIPTLIISAKDDPFLGMTAKPEDVSDSVTLINTKHGGHIGFVSYDKTKKNKLQLTWLASTAFKFFQSVKTKHSHNMQ